MMSAHAALSEDAIFVNSYTAGECNRKCAEGKQKGARVWTVHFEGDRTPHLFDSPTYRGLLHGAGFEAEHRRVQPLAGVRRSHHLERTHVVEVPCVKQGLDFLE